MQQIVALVHPLRIVLFGSRAKGEARLDSDIDVLVLVPDGADRNRILDKIYRDVHVASVPFDVVVATPSILQQHGENIGLIYRDILRTGQEVYAA